MRRFARVALLCLGCGLCSLLYGFSQLALSLEQQPGGGRERQAPDPGARQQAGGGRAGARSAGRGEAGAGRYEAAGAGAGPQGGGRRAVVPPTPHSCGEGRERAGRSPAGGAGPGARPRPPRRPRSPPDGGCRGRGEAAGGKAVLGVGGSGGVAARSLPRAGCWGTEVEKALKTNKGNFKKSGCCGAAGGRSRSPPRERLRCPQAGAVSGRGGGATGLLPGERGSVVRASRPKISQAAS